MYYLIQNDTILLNHTPFKFYLLTIHVRKILQLMTLIDSNYLDQ